MNCNHMIDLIANFRDSQLVFQKKKTITCNILCAVKLGENKIAAL